MFPFYGQLRFREILAGVVQNPLDGVLQSPDQRHGVGVPSGEERQGSSNCCVEPPSAAWARWLYTDGSIEICASKFSSKGREKREVGRCEMCEGGRRTWGLQGVGFTSRGGDLCQHPGDDSTYP